MLAVLIVPLTYHCHVGVHGVLLEARVLGHHLAAQLPGGAVVDVREDHLVQARCLVLPEEDGSLLSRACALLKLIG